MLCDNGPRGAQVGGEGPLPRGAGGNDEATRRPPARHKSGPARPPQPMKLAAGPHQSEGLGAGGRSWRAAATVLGIGCGREEPRPSRCPRARWCAGGLEVPPSPWGGPQLWLLSASLLSREQ